MKRIQNLILLVFVLGFNGSAFAQIAAYDFTGGSLSDSASTPSLLVSDISSESSFNSFTSSSGWDEAAQISGAGTFFSSASDQASSGDALLFTVSADSGYEFNITSFSFEARSTSQAPADIGFTINGTQYDFSASYSNDSTTTTVSEVALGFSGLTSATISIQGWNAPGSSPLQLDNIALGGSVSAVPETNAYALSLGCLGICFALYRRRR